MWEQWKGRVRQKGTEGGREDKISDKSPSLAAHSSRESNPQSHSRDSRIVESDKQHTRKHPFFQIPQKIPAFIKPKVLENTCLLQEKIN